VVVFPAIVYILGAGFSRSAGGPLLREILDKENDANRLAVGRLWENPLYAALMRLHDSLPEEERNIEGLFDSLQSSKFLGRHVGQYSAQTLIDFLTKYLGQLIQERVSEPNDIEVYEHFRDDILSPEEYAIVTFNYDLVADQLLLHARGSLHYGFPSNPKYRYDRLRHARRRPYLLKLHGSLNWVICTVCRTIWLRDRYSTDLHGRSCFRPNCNGRLRLLIVPPVWNKEPAAKDIDLLWKRARMFLGTAEEIEIIGFSFPSADRLAIDMVRDSLKANMDARVSVHNGPNFDYGRLSRILGCPIVSPGKRFEDL
jgi:NAD-dependent SIR2 family protein deacetylase